MTARRVLAVAVAAVLTLGSAAAAADHRPAAGAYPTRVKAGEDCGCTAATRAQSRLDMGLIPGHPAATTTG